MKLHLYTAQGGVDEPKKQPYMDPESASAPARAAAGFAEKAGQVNYQLGNQAIDLASKVNEAQTSVESNKLQGEWQRALVDLDIKLRRDPKFDYNVHDAAIDEQGRGLIDKFAGMATNEQAATRFRALATRALTEKVINLKYEAKTRLEGEVDAANLDANHRMATDVADTMDPELRKLKIEAQERENQDAANRGFIKPEQAGARTRQLQEDVDVILARRSMRKDPSQFLVELEDQEQYSNLTATRRQALTEQAVKLAEQQTKESTAKKKEYSGALKKHLIDRMDQSGVNTDSEIRALRDSLTDEDYDHLIARNAKIQKGETMTSDATLLAQRESQIRFGGLRDHRVIDAESSKYTPQDYRHLVGLIDAKKEAERQEKKSDAEKTRNDLVASGKTLLNGMFRLTGVMNFDAEAETTKALALSEYENKMARERDKDPAVVANEIMLRYSRTLADKLSGRDPSTLQPVIRFQTEEELKAAYAAKQITVDEFLAQKRNLDYYLFLRNLGGGGPKPDSGTPKPNSGTGAPKPKSSGAPTPGNVPYPKGG
jgi:hypothetical protein